MRWSWLRNSAILAAVVFCADSRGYASDPVRVNTRVFDIEYAVNDAALPLDSVQLWYTLDDGRTWRHYGYDDDGHSPFTFQAPEEGPFGFFVVLQNSTGASSEPPAPGTAPHQTAFVDYTPPVVQLHELRPTVQFGQRILQLRWTAIDANLITRPMELSYRSIPDTSWHPINPDRAANTGRFDWRLPDEVRGSIAVRVAAVDQGGNRVDSKEQVADLSTISGPPQDLDQDRLRSSNASRESSPINSVTASPRAGARAAHLYADAISHRDRGELRRSIALLRDAVRLDPNMTEAFAEMASLLYLLGDLDKSINAYEIALTQRPSMRSALQGAARVYRRKNDYASAAERLRTILRYNPNDAEVWMNLGDIAVYQGDEILARDCYSRATKIDPQATDVIAAARKRLELMQRVSRTYSPLGR